MSRFPDRARSRAVLIGVSHFPESPELAELLAVRENVASLWRRLTHDTTGVLEPEHCEVVDPASSTADIGRAISKAAADATDMLLIYYAGHGLVDDRGRLYLATNATQADAPKYSALSVHLLREDLASSAAAARVLILDCCFSGRAIEVMTGEEGLLDGQLSIAGTYTMTSTSANAPSYALAGERYTAFTGELLAALNSPQPLTLDKIYRKVTAELQSRGLPRPRQRATDTAGDLALSRGTAEHDQQPTHLVDEVRFHQDRATQMKQLKESMKWHKWGAAFLVVAMPAWFAATSHDMRWLWGIPLLGIFMAIAMRFPGLLPRFIPSENELVIDRSAISLKWQYIASTQELRIRWMDISHVGVLPPRRSVLLPWKRANGRDHLLVVRPRTGVPFHSTKSTLFHDELHKLGYRFVIHLATVGADKEQILAALDQFAGDRVLHTEEEFMAHDPRIQPTMF